VPRPPSPKNAKAARPSPHDPQPDRLPARRYGLDVVSWVLLAAVAVILVVLVPRGARHALIPRPGRSGWPLVGGAVLVVVLLGTCAWPRKRRLLPPPLREVIAGSGPGRSGDPPAIDRFPARRRRLGGPGPGGGPAPRRGACGRCPCPTVSVAEPVVRVLEVAPAAATEDTGGSTPASAALPWESLALGAGACGRCANVDSPTVSECPAQYAGVSGIAMTTLYGGDLTVALRHASYQEGDLKWKPPRSATRPVFRCDAGIWRRSRNT
jgi:hypothetical protein